MKAVAAPCGIATYETTFWGQLRRIHDETFPTAVIERNQVYIFRILPGFSSWLKSTPVLLGMCVEDLADDSPPILKLVQKLIVGE